MSSDRITDLEATKEMRADLQFALVPFGREHAEPILAEWDRLVAADARAVRAEAVVEAAREVLARVMTRRVGLHMDGTEQWSQPLLKEVADLLRNAFDDSQLDSVLAGQEGKP